MTQFLVIWTPTGAADLRLAGEPGPARPAHPDLQAGRLLARGWRSRSASTGPWAGRRPTWPSTRAASTRPRSCTTASGRSTTARSIIFKSLESDDWDLFVAAIETTDRVSHMMWRLIDPKHPMYDTELAAKYGDAIEKVYRRADDLVGRLQAKLPKDAVFMVMSDHGFHSFRRGVNLNTWLVQNGYMVFEGQVGREEGPGRPLRPRQVLGGRRLEPDQGLRGGPRPDLLQPEGPRGPGHRLRGRRVHGPAGRDPRQARDRSWTPTTGERGLRATSTSATTSTRASTSSTRPTCRWASTTGTAWAGRTPWAGSSARWWRTTTASGAATTAPPPPRSAAACSSPTARSPRERPTSWTSPPPS